MMTQGGGAGGTGGGGGCLNINTLKSVLDEIWQKTETPMFISEYDIGTEDDNTQKKCYEEQISLFMENEHVAGITLWGYIYGATWVTNGNSGIIKDGRDRAAMTWLKDYLSKNKGVNTTGLPTGDAAAKVDPEPQLPFKGTAFAIPGKIEAEDFDIPGKGKNDDGTSNQSYADSDTENHGDSDYRSDTGVDLYKKATGVVVGYNSEGDWLEYTINVSEAGEYTFFAAVAAAGSTSSFKMSLDGNPLTETISVPAASSGEENYDDYNKVSANVTLPAGQHVLRMDVTGAWFDVDYFTFVKGANATDPEPIGGGDPLGFASNLQLDETNTLQHYYVLDPQGVRMGVISGYGFKATAELLRSSSAVKSSGMYYLRNRATGKMQAVRIVR